MRPERHIVSSAKVRVFSLLTSLWVLGLSLLVQWFVYDDWPDQRGSMRIAGISIGTVVTVVLVFRWHLSVRRSHQEMMRRFEAISRLNDQIRNALQAIVCVKFVREPQFTEQVRQALDVIDHALRGMLKDVEPDSTVQKFAGRGSAHSARKSA